MKRCEKIAALLVEGMKGNELEAAVQEFDRTHVPEVVTRFEAPITARAYRRSSSAPAPDVEQIKPFLRSSSTSRSTKRLRAASSQPTRASSPLSPPPTDLGPDDFYNASMSTGYSNAEFTFAPKAEPSFVSSHHIIFFSLFITLFRISTHSFMKKHGRPTHPLLPHLSTTGSTCTRPICPKGNSPRYCLSTPRLHTSGQIPLPSRRRLRHLNCTPSEVARLPPISTRTFRSKTLISIRLTILLRSVDPWIWREVSSFLQRSMRSPKTHHNMCRLKTRNRN